jgi:hypothetical protein
VLLAAALLILCFISLSLLLFLTWNKADVVPMPDYEVYESMSAE